MKYVIEFSKTGTICYTSHLDIMKVFKRAFKKADIRLAYSQGYNPHPKMGFAQPLSLGYEGIREYIEFETSAEFDGGNHSPEHILKSLAEIMPEGLDLKKIMETPDLKKTLAAETVAAEYRIEIPLANPLPLSQQQMWDEYMGRSDIPALKKQKKKPEPVTINIRPKIRQMQFDPSPEMLVIDARLDSGSDSNLSPELVISTVLEIFGIDCDRADINVTRNNIIFAK